MITNVFSAYYVYLSGQADFDKASFHAWILPNAPKRCVSPTMFAHERTLRSVSHENEEFLSKHRHFYWATKKIARKRPQLNLLLQKFKGIRKLCMVMMEIAVLRHLWLDLKCIFTRKIIHTCNGLWQVLIVLIHFCKVLAQ